MLLLYCIAGLLLVLLSECFCSIAASYYWSFSLNASAPLLSQDEAETFREVDQKLVRKELKHAERWTWSWPAIQYCQVIKVEKRCREMDLELASNNAEYPWLFLFSIWPIS
jgi:hypothetical protein